MPAYLYRHTLAEARRWDEMDLYKESLQANVSCIDNGPAEAEGASMGHTI